MKLEHFYLETNDFYMVQIEIYALLSLFESVSYDWKLHLKVSE